MSTLKGNAADRVVRGRITEPVHFPDLTERLTLKLASLSHYTARIHFGAWHRRIGGPNFREFTGVFTPLVFVDVEVTEAVLDPMARLHVRGETYLAYEPDANGTVARLVREGRHVVLTAAGDVVGRAHLMNVFTRYDPDPARRRVTALPPELGLGSAPSRVTTVPTVHTLVPRQQADVADTERPVWHYGQTDPNRHVSGMEYLRAMESWVASGLCARGHDVRRLYFTRARIVYRKPCFRGEGYRRRLWFRGEEPVVVGAFNKADDTADAPPAVAIELTLAQHPADIGDA